MKIDDVFIVNLSVMVLDEKSYSKNCLKKKEEHYGRAVVYYADNKYIDLKSGKRYKTDDEKLYLGNVFINKKRTIMPIRTILNELNQVNHSNKIIKDNMTKRKILKIFK